ncbi:hypothetical protein K456DRAFT_78281 [Colletotrichum gloeosporioides 23]|nr:hypothetical protein K456DRAFT_78281 [Colletotrichum gloeosporioides 23]
MFLLCWTVLFVENLFLPLLAFDDSTLNKGEPPQYQKTLPIFGNPCRCLAELMSVNLRAALTSGAILGVSVASWARPRIGRCWTLK